jgi:hypothetical protein
MNDLKFLMPADHERNMGVRRGGWLVMRVRVRCVAASRVRVAMRVLRQKSRALQVLMPRRRKPDGDTGEGDEKGLERHGSMDAQALPKCKSAQSGVVG